MTPWWIALALAGPAEPASVQITHTPDAIRQVRPIAHVTMSPAWPASMHATPEPLTEGVLVVVDVDPRFGRARDAKLPVLYARDRPAELLTRAPDGRCMVVLLPAVQPLFFGSVTLPERVDAPRGRAEWAAGRPVAYAWTAPAGLHTVSHAPLSLLEAARDLAGTCPIVPTRATEQD